jgi:hypothetical protein
MGPSNWHFEFREDDFLTRQEFAFLYDKTSDVLHAWNPFSKRTPVIDFHRPIADWAARIEGLLSHHLIRLQGQSDLLLVQLTGTDGRAHVLTAAPVAA